MNTMRKNLLYRLFSPKESEQKTDLCVGCHWKAVGRFQKCSCCKRNGNMKDNYQPEVKPDGQY